MNHWRCARRVLARSRSPVRQPIVARRLWPILGLVATLAAGCLAPPCPDRPAVRVQFLLVNDVYRLDHEAGAGGGLARATTLIREMRRQTPHTLVALAGD